ncbi:hypothetical protein [Candidatus Vidania fulgoroideorum]
MKEIINKYISKINSIFKIYKENITKLRNMEIDISTLKNIRLKNNNIYIKDISEIYIIGDIINIKVKKQYLKEIVKEINNYSFIKFKKNKNIITIKRKIEEKYKNEIKKELKTKIEEFKIKTRVTISKLKKEVKNKLGKKIRINKELEEIRNIVLLQVRQLVKVF